MKTVLILFLPLLATLYSMDVVPYKYPLTFTIESQRKVEVPLHTLGFSENKEESLNLDTCLEVVRRVPLKQLAYEEWLKGNFLLLARIVSMSSEQKPIVSWCDTRTLVNVSPRSPRNRCIDMPVHRFTLPEKCGEIFYYFVPHDKYTSVLGYLCSETELYASMYSDNDSCSTSTELAKYLIIYHAAAYNNQHKIQMLESIIQSASQVYQTGQSHIPYIYKHYVALLPTLKLLCKEKRSRNDHKAIAGQELNKQAQVNSQLQLGYRYLRRRNNNEAIRWLSKVAIQDFFPEKRKDAQEILEYLEDDIPLLFAKKMRPIRKISGSNIKLSRNSAGKNEAEEYS